MHAFQKMFFRTKQMFMNSESVYDLRNWSGFVKHVHEFKKYLQFSKIVHEFKNCSCLQKMFTIFKNFKILVNVNNFLLKCSQFL